MQSKRSLEIRLKNDDGFWFSIGEEEEGSPGSLNKETRKETARQALHGKQPKTPTRTSTTCLSTRTSSSLLLRPLLPRHHRRRSNCCRNISVSRRPLFYKARQVPTSEQSVDFQQRMLSLSMTINPLTT